MIPIYPAQPMICLGILYGFLTIFCVTPSQIICARAFLIKGDSAGSIALIGSLIGQLCLVLLILSPLGVVWNRCYFGFLLTSIWFLWRTQKQFQLRSLKYESSSQSSFHYKLILFIDSFIFQLLNPIALPNSICYRIITPILFRYSSHLSFAISLVIGLIISNFFFVQLTRNLRNRIQYDALKTYQFIVPSLNNIFINFVWSLIFLSLSRFTWGSYQDAFIKKDRWYNPLRLEKLRFKTRTSDCFFDNFIVTDKRKKIFSTYLPKWSNLINGIENYTSVQKVDLVEGYENESKILENDIQKYNYSEKNCEQDTKSITKKQAKVLMIQLPRNKKNDFTFSWNIAKIDSPNYVRRDLSLFLPKRAFNYIGYIQEWLSNNWNQDRKQVLFLPFSWEPLTYDECNEAFFLLHSSNKKFIQMLANQKLKNRLLKYKENTIKDLPGTPLASKIHNEKLQKWQEEVESLPWKVGIRKLKLLRFYIQKQRQEDLNKKIKIDFRRTNLRKLEPSYRQQAFLHTFLKRNLAIHKLKKEYQSIILPKQLSTYNKEAIKIKKRNKRLKGTLKAKLRKKHENRYFAPFRYFYMFEVNKIRDNLIKTKENQISQGVSLLTVLSEKEKRWLTCAQKSLYIRDLRKQQLRKQRDIAYKKSPFRWLANFVYTSNALLFLKLRKPILLVKAALKGAICCFLRKDFSFQEEIKDLDNLSYLIYDVEGNLMPPGKLPEWWFIHGFTVKRKFKEKKNEDIKRKFLSKEKKEIEPSSSFIMDEIVKKDDLKGYRKMVSNRDDSKKDLEFPILGINTKKAKSVNVKMRLLKKKGISNNRITNLLIFSLVRVILFLEFQIVEINKLSLSFLIISLRNCKNITVYIKLLTLKIREIPNVLHLKKLFFLKLSFQSIQKFTINKLIFLCGKIYLKIKSLTLFNQLSSNLHKWNFFNNKILLFLKNSIARILNICFYNVYIYSLKKFFFKEYFLMSFSYLKFLEKISRSMLIFRLDSHSRIKDLSAQTPCPVFFSNREKEKDVQSFITVNNIESRFKLCLKDLENYHLFLTNLHKNLKLQTNYFHVLINNYLKEIYSFNRKNIQLRVNRQNISPIRVITKGKISTISLQKRIEFTKLLKNLQLSNTNRFLESWLFHYTKYNNHSDKKIEQETTRLFCKIQKREIKRKKVIEEYLYYLYSSIFSFKGDWKKSLNNLIHFDSNEYKIGFFQRDLTDIHEWSIFSFYNEKIQPLNYNFFINDKKNSYEIMKDALVRIEANNNFNLFYLLASKKTSVQASSLHPVLLNLNNNVNGFFGKHSSILENLEQLSLFSLNTNKRIEKPIKGIDDQSLQKLKIHLNLSHHVFHCLFLEDIGNFYYNILPHLVIFHSVCSKNQFYHFWNKNRTILNKIKKLSHRKRFFQFSTIVNHYLLPNYRIEDLVCMERVWFTNGKRYSTRRIFTDPWITHRPQNLQNIMWIYKDPFFYKT